MGVALGKSGMNLGDDWDLLRDNLVFEGLDTNLETVAMGGLVIIWSTTQNKKKHYYKLKQVP